MEKILESGFRKEYHFGPEVRQCLLEDGKLMEHIQVEHICRVGVVLGASDDRCTGGHHGEWAAALDSVG